VSEKKKSRDYFWYKKLMQRRQNAYFYRRDLLYSVEYGTTQIEVGTQITQTQLNVDSDVAGTGQFQPVATCFD